MLPSIALAAVFPPSTADDVAVTPLITTPGLLMSTPLGNCCEGGGAGTGAGAGLGSATGAGAGAGSSSGSGTGAGVGPGAGASPATGLSAGADPVPPPHAVNAAARNRAVKVAARWERGPLSMILSFMICSHL